MLYNFLTCLFRRIAEGLEECIPNLESLILTGNQIEELCDIDPLIPLTKLTTLSLLHNPITAKAHYRLYIAFKLPQVTLLDFCKIRQKEREEANTLFKSKKGKELLKEISKKAKISANINVSDANKGNDYVRQDVTLKICRKPLEYQKFFSHTGPKLENNILFHNSKAQFFF